MDKHFHHHSKEWVTGCGEGWSGRGEKEGEVFGRSASGCFGMNAKANECKK